MPEMIFTRVDLPAPLSPTSAVTWWRSAEKSTSVSAWTPPKRLLILLSSSRGAGVGMLAPFRGALLGQAELLAGRGRRARADVGRLEEAVQIIWVMVCLALALVTATGVRMIEATSFWPLLVFCLARLSAADRLPLTRSTASSAACPASGLIAL